MPDVGITAGRKFWMKGKMPPKTVNNARDITINFSVLKIIGFRKPYNKPATPIAIMMNW